MRCDICGNETLENSNFCIICGEQIGVLFYDLDTKKMLLKDGYPDRFVSTVLLLLIIISIVITYITLK